MNKGVDRSFFCSSSFNTTVKRTFTCWLRKPAPVMVHVVPVETEGKGNKEQEKEKKLWNTTQVKNKIRQKKIQTLTTHR